MTTARDRSARAMMAARVHPPTTYGSQICVFSGFSSDFSLFFFCGSDFFFLVIVNSRPYYSDPQKLDVLFDVVLDLHLIGFIMV
jgi:hypothetical protein